MADVRAALALTLAVLVLAAVGLVTAAGVFGADPW